VLHCQPPRKATRGASDHGVVVRVLRFLREIGTNTRVLIA
jgi:hypothetical protein